MIVRFGRPVGADGQQDVGMTDSDGTVAQGGDESGAAGQSPARRGIKRTMWNFRLGFGMFTPTRPNEANYAAYMRLKTAPPNGCTFREDYGYARLECRRPGTNRFAAVGRLVREIRTDFGLAGTDDLGIEKLWEWVVRDREWAESIAGQLLLMGVSRAEQLGIDVEDVVALVRDAMAPLSVPRQAAGRQRSVAVSDPGPASNVESGASNP
jgi:hypothetical protein